MNKNYMSCLLVFLSILSLSVPVFALADLVQTSTLYKVIYDKTTGLEKLEPTEEAQVGDILELQITYTNQGNEKAKKVLIMGPIKQGAEYIEGSAYCSLTQTVYFSIDGGKTFHVPPVKYTVTEQNRTVEKTAPASMYTHIRWDLKNGLKPGESVFAKYRVKVVEE